MWKSESASLADAAVAVVVARPQAAKALPLMTTAINARKQKGQVSVIKSELVLRTCSNLHVDMFGEITKAKIRMCRNVTSTGLMQALSVPISSFAADSQLRLAVACSQNGFPNYQNVIN